MLPQIDGQTHVNPSSVGFQKSGALPEPNGNISVGVTEVGQSLARGRDESVQDVDDSLAQLGEPEEGHSSAISNFPQVNGSSVAAPLSSRSSISLLPYKIVVSLRPNDASRALCKTVAKGHLDDMRAWLHAGAHPDSKNASGETALALAVRNRSTQAVTELLRAGACINLVDSSGRTPLLHAIQEAHIGVVEVLLRFQAEIDVCDNKGFAALTVAVQRGNADTVRLLLEAGASVDLRDKHGLTPLMWAALNKHPEVVDMLLKAGAAIDVQDGSGRYLLDHAVKPRNVQVLDRLLKGGVHFNAASYASARLPSLRTAIENECWDVVESLVGARVKARISQNDLAAWGLWPVTNVNQVHLEKRLEHALQAGHLHTSRLLIAALNASGDAFVTNGAASIEGMTHSRPLTWLELAARCAPLPIVLDLLEGLKPEPIGDESGAEQGGKLSARVRQTQTIATHLGLGNELFELQAAQQMPQTSHRLQADYVEHLNRALASAAQANRWDVVRSLIELGADAHAHFNDQASAISAAIENGNLDMFHFLTES
ncbi:MAG: ankyrin repeat domain-containing protein [Comamonadaceae bacterium]|nr:ankyrin repeat domain-containing protein [Comamonadaceae bacterium]